MSTHTCPACHVPLAHPAGELLTIAEAAAYLHCSRATVNRLLRSGQVRRLKTSRRFVRVPLEELRLWVGQHCQRCGGRLERCAGEAYCPDCTRFGLA